MFKNMRNVELEAINLSGRIEEDITELGIFDLGLKG